MQHGIVDSSVFIALVSAWKEENAPFSRAEMVYFLIVLYGFFLLLV